MNFGEPVIANNFLLQHRLGKASGTIGRFAINSMIVVGTLDIAKREP